MAAPLADTDPRSRLTSFEKLRLGSEVVAAYARVRYLLARRQLPEALERLRTRTRRLPDAAAEPHWLNRWRLADAVTRVLSVLPTDSRCLVRSLVLIRLMDRRGLDAALVIGVRSAPFAAHAWVERQGRPLLPTGGDDYRRLAVL